MGDKGRKGSVSLHSMPARLSACTLAPRREVSHGARGLLPEPHVYDGKGRACPASVPSGRSCGAYLPLRSFTVQLALSVRNSNLRGAELGLQPVLVRLQLLKTRLGSPRGVDAVVGRVQTPSRMVCLRARSVLTRLYCLLRLPAAMSSGANCSVIS